MKTVYVVEKDRRCDVSYERPNRLIFKNDGSIEYEEWYDTEIYCPDAEESYTNTNITEVMALAKKIQDHPERLMKIDGKDEEYLFMVNANENIPTS